jgi:hypothetical protein
MLFFWLAEQIKLIETIGRNIEGAWQITGAADQKCTDGLTAGPDALGAQAIVRLFCCLFGQERLHQRNWPTL